MYVIRYNDLKGAVDPQRRLVKLSAQHLWRAPSPEGTSDWEPGHEIRSDALGISLFTTGTDEILHYHERSWEIYQALDGQLKIAVKPFCLASWEVISLSVHDMVILTPGTIHLVDGTCLHVTQVIQSPPSLTDKVVIHQLEEINAARAMLQEQCCKNITSLGFDFQKFYDISGRMSISILGGGDSRVTGFGFLL